MSDGRVSTDYDFPIGMIATAWKGVDWVFIGYYYTTEGPSACFVRSLTGADCINFLCDEWDYGYDPEILK